jgi:hypothetical protein
MADGAATAGATTFHLFGKHGKGDMILKAHLMLSFHILLVHTLGHQIKDCSTITMLTTIFL